MENMTNKEYQQYAEKKIPKPTYFKKYAYGIFSRRDYMYHWPTY